MITKTITSPEWYNKAFFICSHRIDHYYQRVIVKLSPLSEWPWSCFPFVRVIVKLFLLSKWSPSLPRQSAHQVVSLVRVILYLSPLSKWSSSCPPCLSNHSSFPLVRVIVELTTGSARQSVKQPDHMHNNLNSNWVRDGRGLKITNSIRSLWPKDRYDQKIANPIRSLKL